MITSFPSLKDTFGRGGGWGVFHPGPNIGNSPPAPPPLYATSVHRNILISSVRCIYSRSTHNSPLPRTFHGRTKKSRNLVSSGPARLYAVRAVCPCKILQCAMQIQRTPLCVEQWGGGQLVVDV